MSPNTIGLAYGEGSEWCLGKWIQALASDIQPGSMTGKMPKRAIKLIWDWLDEHQDELLENWERVRNRQALNRIDPLP